MKYFKLSEFDCKETGENKMNREFLDKLDLLRHRCGFPFFITSGFRSVKHSIEAKKEKGGTHTQGIAADIAVSNGAQRMKLIKAAIELGFTVFSGAYPVLQHSEKPSEFRDACVELAGDVPRIELFSRKRVKGWAMWGNEVGKLNKRKSKNLTLR